MPKATAPKKATKKAPPAENAAPQTDNRPITGRVTTVEELFAVAGLNPEEYLPFKNVPVNHLPEGEDDGFNEQRWHNAAATIRLLCKVLNKDYTTGKEWVPDWNNWNERKWRPLFRMDNPAFRFLGSFCDYVSSAAGAGSGLCMPNSELDTRFIKMFIAELSILMREHE